MKAHVHRPSVTWVLVADAKQAQIYTPKQVERRIPLVGNGKHRHVEEIHARELAPILARPLSAESAKNYETGRNKTGMVFESFSSARHMAEPHLDARKEVMQRFARRVADFIGSAKNGEAFDRLVLVAPPVMLGEIDACLTEHIQRKVTAKVPRELTRCTEVELTGRLGKYF